MCAFIITDKDNNERGRAGERATDRRRKKICDREKSGARQSTAANVHICVKIRSFRWCHHPYSRPMDERERENSFSSHDFCLTNIFTVPLRHVVFGVCVRVVVAAICVCLFNVEPSLSVSVVHLLPVIIHIRMAEDGWGAKSNRSTKKRTLMKHEFGFWCDKMRVMCMQYNLHSSIDVRFVHSYGFYQINLTLVYYSYRNEWTNSFLFPQAFYKLRQRQKCHDWCVIITMIWGVSVT